MNEQRESRESMLSAHFDDDDDDEDDDDDNDDDVVVDLIWPLSILE